jgi:hypothetical protein
MDILITTCAIMALFSTISLAFLALKEFQTVRKAAIRVRETKKRFEKWNKIQ